MREQLRHLAVGLGQFAQLSNRRICGLRLRAGIVRQPCLLGAAWCTHRVLVAFSEHRYNALSLLNLRLSRNGLTGVEAFVPSGTGVTRTRRESVPSL